MPTMDDPSPPQPSPQGSSRELSPSLGAAGTTSAIPKPRLGDFSKLLLSKISPPTPTTSESSHCSAGQARTPTPSSLPSHARSSSPDSLRSREVDKQSPVQHDSTSSLGNFSRILGSLKLAESSTNPPASDHGTLRTADDLPIFQYTGQKILTAKTPHSPEPRLPSASQKAVDHGYVKSISPGIDIPESQDAPVFSSASASLAPSSEESDSAASTSATSVSSVSKKLSYAAATTQPVTIHGAIHSHSQAYKLSPDPHPSIQYQSLVAKLMAEAYIDRLTEKTYPHAANNGVYVFLDTSNIEISFRKALRVKLGIPETAILMPAPNLNMDFLNKILVRDRHAVSKNAGCSYRPGRPKPHAVRELTACGFHVDVRERKLQDDQQQQQLGTSPNNNNKRNFHALGSSRATNASADNGHYVEDLVDETLQTRIYESVMENFEQPGTLVLATGDGKAAKYSDGFFACANRALKMGWHVELVSWGLSLSSVWKDDEWSRQWGGRFRLIFLDSYLDEIWTSQKTQYPI